MRLFGKLPKEFGEPWRQQDGVAAQDQGGLLVTELEVSRRQVAKTFGGQAEQQGDRAAGPGRPKTLAPAVDRLLHHAHIALTEGSSLRLTQATSGQGGIPLVST